jgi:hypothetical protein
MLNPPQVNCPTTGPGAAYRTLLPSGMGVVHLVRWRGRNLTDFTHRQHQFDKFCL